MTNYEAYGYVINSDLKLNLATSSSTNPDIFVSLNDIYFNDLPEIYSENHFEDDYQRLYWPFAGCAEVYSGNRIILTPLEGVDTSIFAFAILGPIIALIMHRHSITTFHASCVAVNGRAVAFMGDKGAGKSTLGAAMIAADHRLVADDIAAVSRDLNANLCRFGYPLMKLSTNTLAAFPTFSDYPKARSPVGDKHIITFPKFERPNVPLQAFFVLKRGESPGMRRCNAEEAFGNLMRYCYPIRFGTAILKLRASRDFTAEIARLSNTVPVYELTSANELDKIEQTVSLVELAAADEG